MKNTFIVTTARFNKKDPLSFVVQGFFRGGSITGSRMSALLDGRQLEMNISCREGLAVRQKYFNRGPGYEDIDREYDLWITLPEDFLKAGKLSVFQEQDRETRRVCRFYSRDMAYLRQTPDGYLETFRNYEGSVSIGGWAVGCGMCSFRVTDMSGRDIPCSFTRHYRQDIVDSYPELAGLADEEPQQLFFGYEVTFRQPSSRKVRLIVTSDGQKDEYRLDLKKGIKGARSSVSAFRRVADYVRRNGISASSGRAWEKIRQKMKSAGSGDNYMSWRRQHEPGREELAEQSRHRFSYEPLISVVVPLYRTDPGYLKALVDSVKAQTYRNWELCLSDGSGEDSPLKDVLEKLSARDPRIKVTDRHTRMKISENTNAALSVASGEYIAFADHDDMISPDALYECVRLISQKPGTDMIYSDEDKVSMDGRVCFEPHFKSDFNIDLLCSMNYICHLLVVKRSLLEKTGGFDPAYDGAQDYDFILRCVEQAHEISHIPKVLYHWRTHWGSTAGNPHSKMYAFEAGQRAVQAHFDRTGIRASVCQGLYPGLYRVKYLIPEKQPLISVIIPNMDHVDDLDACVRSIIERSSYRNFEFIIVENNSAREETFEYYRMMEQKYDFFHVVRWKGSFNYSAINNFGAARADGEYLLFLNNDTKIITDDCLEELLGPCLRPEVGAVGALLLYPDDTIQHAGLIIGYGGIAGHAFAGMKDGSVGYFSRIVCQSDLSAVTAACMMVSKSAFRSAGGFDEKLAVAFNDVDLCLKIREKGYLIVYNPYARLYHYESKSRGAEDTQGKISRFNTEADILLKRWKDILRNGDPYYNPNLSLDSNDFRLKS